MKNWVWKNALYLSDLLLVIGLFWFLLWGIGLAVYFKFPTEFKYFVELQSVVSLLDLFESFFVGFGCLLFSTFFYLLYEFYFTKGAFMKFLNIIINLFIIILILILIFGLFIFFMILPFINEANKPVSGNKSEIIK